MDIHETPAHTETIEQNLGQYGLSTYFTSRFADVGFDRDKGIIMCVLKESYVPIEKFKEIFATIGKLASQREFDKFIFDKRSLRAFHQPSMEWYFIEWKKEVYSFGINKHRKILPAEAWFKKMVQIAKSQILSDYPDNIVHLLDIQYCNSVEESISK
jgi:hypothetical protein